MITTRESEWFLRVVGDANTLTRPIHDRMPVLLDETNFQPWLSGAAKAVTVRDRLDKESARFAKAKHHLRGALSRTHRKIVARIHQRFAFRF